MEQKFYLQLNIPNILTIGLIVFLIYTFSGVVLSTVKNYLPSSQGN